MGGLRGRDLAATNAARRRRRRDERETRVDAATAASRRTRDAGAARVGVRVAQEPALLAELVAREALQFQTPFLERRQRVVGVGRRRDQGRGWRRPLRPPAAGRPGREAVSKQHLRGAVRAVVVQHVRAALQRRGRAHGHDAFAVDGVFLAVRRVRAGARAVDQIQQRHADARSHNLRGRAARLLEVGARPLDDRVVRRVAFLRRVDVLDGRVRDLEEPATGNSADDPRRLCRSGGGPAQTTRLFCRDESRRRRGRDVDIL